jgi:quercetin dioxygenase-like cupin family protein
MSGGGAAHIYLIHLAPGGVIGAHEAGFDQLFVPLQGSGWAAGTDAVRHQIVVGQAAVFRRGEVHAKGSEIGLVALMVQVEQATDACAAGQRDAAGDKRE